MPIGFVFVALAALGLVGFVYATKPARDKLMREQADADAARAARDACLAIRDLISVKRGQGADLNEIARLEAELANCARRTGAVQAWEAPLVAMEGKRRQIALEFANYRSTWWGDTLKRDSTLGTIWRLSDDYVSDAKAALLAALDSREGSERIVSELSALAEDSFDRVRCHATPGACGNGDSDRAMEEIKRAFLPIAGTGETRARFAEFIAYMGERAAAATADVEGLIDRARAQVRANTRLDGARVARIRPAVTGIPSNVRTQLRIR